MYAMKVMQKLWRERSACEYSCCPGQRDLRQCDENRVRLPENSDFVRQEAVGGEEGHAFSPDTHKSNGEVSIFREQSVVEDSVGFELPLVYCKSNDERGANEYRTKDVTASPGV